MAVNIPSLNVNAIGEGLKDQNNYETILDILQRYRKELNFYLMNLDLDNMPAVAEDIDWIHQDIDGVKITVGNNAGNIANLSITASEIQSSVMDLNTYTNEQLALIDGEFQTVHTTISDQYSSITQRANAIEANVGNVVTSVSTLGTTVTQNHANITQRATSIESTVTSITKDINDLNGDVDLAYSQISQLATDITAKVTIGEVTNYLSINRDGVQINASNIDLTGITTIYNSNGSYTTMYGQGLRIVANTGQTTYSYPITFDTYISFELGRGIGTVFPDVVNFDGTVAFNSYVNFRDAIVEGLDLRFA